MRNLRYTLITDGPSDRTLVHLINWIFRSQYQGAVEEQWFDPRSFRNRPLSIENRIKYSLELFPCEVLFIHRDAESEDPQQRFDEINNAAEFLINCQQPVPHICVVPVRMTEAWLLFDESAIRKAVGNPNGNMQLNLPNTNRVENLPDPKNVLFTAFKDACGLNQRRTRKLRLNRCRHRVAEIINDYSPLRPLPAFQRLESDILVFLESIQAG